MSKIYVLNYNNYGNRLVKKESSLADYLSADSDYRTYSDINFYRGDGVNTTQTVNFPVGSTEKDADYLIVTNTINNVESIVSRWFIIECNYNRKQQLIFTLRRDLIVDFWNDIYTNAVSDGYFCEKGAVGISDNFIFNPEEMTFNQVLDDRWVFGSTSTTAPDQRGYIVGYIDKKAGGLQIASSEAKIITVNTRNDIPGYKAAQMGKLIYNNSAEFSYDFYAVYGKSPQNYNSGDSVTSWKSSIVRNNMPNTAEDTQVGGTLNFPAWKSQVGATGLEGSNYPGIHDYLAGIGRTVITSGLLDFLKGEMGYENSSDYYYDPNNKPIYFVRNENAYYSAGVIQGSWSTTTSALTPIPSGGFEEYVKSYVFSTWAERYVGTTIGGWIDETMITQFPIQSLKYRVRYAAIELEDVTSTYSFGKVPEYNDRYHVAAPYDIFVAQYSPNALRAASNIAAGLYGSGALIDLQRVPWVPSYTTVKSWYIDGSYFYWLQTDQAVNQTVTYSRDYSLPIARTDVKVDALTHKWRVMSPNHANGWDFNPAMNRGVSGWTYDILLKPYQPYIHIKPIFNDTGLYKNDDTIEFDQRGLICQGSFSLPISSDQWSTYQINNSAYANSFERDVEHLDTVQDAERIMQKWQIAAGTISAATQGVLAGANAGGGVGAAIGGVVAGVGSLATGIADYQISEKLRNEAIDYKRDQFGYMLQNIQARPRTFSQSTSFDPNNTIFPYIDEYVCTTEEETALKAKLKRNGMTIMRIGSFKEFWDNAGSDVPYVKGKLIRMPSSFKDDTHVFNEIANELYKGVYRY